MVLTVQNVALENDMDITELKHGLLEILSVLSLFTEKESQTFGRSHTDEVVRLHISCTLWQN